LGLGKAEFKEKFENSVNSSAFRVQLAAVKTFCLLVEALEKPHTRRCAAKLRPLPPSLAPATLDRPGRHAASGNRPSNAIFQARADGSKRQSIHGGELVPDERRIT